MNNLRPYDTFKFRAYPFRWVAVWLCWNLGVLLEKMGAVDTKPSGKYGRKP
jgi:hypothetical protein